MDDDEGEESDLVEVHNLDELEYDGVGKDNFNEVEPNEGDLRKVELDKDNLSEGELKEDNLSSPDLEVIKCVVSQPKEIKNPKVKSELLPLHPQKEE